MELVQEKLMRVTSCVVESWIMSCKVKGVQYEVESGEHMKEII